MDPVLLIGQTLPRIRRLVLNRQAKRNALNDELRGRLFEELRTADADRDVSVIVIRANRSDRDRAFGDYREE